MHPKHCAPPADAPTLTRQPSRRALLGAMAALPLLGTGAAVHALSAVPAPQPDPLPSPNPAPLTTGIDRLDQLAALTGTDRLALLTHAAGVDREGRRSADVLAGDPRFRLAALWSPEHGFAASAAAGAHVGDGTDAATGLPVLSLYGARRAPDAAMLDGIDTIIIDLVDVGARPYTYVSTVKAVLAAAAGRRVILIDRPNPVGGVVMEGPVLDPALASFVGAHPVALRHGMTLGELAMMINDEAGIGAALTIVPVMGWQRADGTGVMVDGRLPFVPPSPNLRAPSAILGYSGMVLVEGTNLSEGRGTDRPFETIGAPWIKTDELAEALWRTPINGVEVTRTGFTPATSKFAGEACEGVELWAEDRRGFRAVTMALTLLTTVARLYPRDFAFLTGAPPFFDRLAGQGWLRDMLLAGAPVAEMEGRWADGLAAFAARRAAYLLYR